MTGYDRSLDWATTPLVDRVGVSLGVYQQKFQGAVGDFLAAHPAGAFALEVGSVALTVAGGPLRYGLGKALDYTKDSVTGWITDRYSAAGWNNDPAALGGRGAVWGASIALNGAGAFKASALLVGALGPRLGSNRVNSLDTSEHPDVVSYARPSSFRKGIRDQVWENAKGPDGLVRDPVTERIMHSNEPWDMGHLPGFEFRKHQQSAIERSISRKQFLDEHNDPMKYRPELPSSNRSHRGEILTDDYFGE